MKEIKLAYSYGTSLTALVKEYGHKLVAYALNMPMELVYDTMDLESENSALKMKNAPKTGMFKNLFHKEYGPVSEKEKPVINPNVKINLNVDQNTIEKMAEELVELSNAEALKKMLKGGGVAKPASKFDPTMTPATQLSKGGFPPPSLTAKLDKDTLILTNEVKELPQPLEELFDSIELRLNSYGELTVQFRFMGSTVEAIKLIPSYTSSGDVKYTIEKHGSVQT